MKLRFSWQYEGNGAIFQAQIGLIEVIINGCAKHSPTQLVAMSYTICVFKGLSLNDIMMRSAVLWMTSSKLAISKGFSETPVEI